MEGYGIIYNNKILRDYCALDGAKIKSAEEINSFAKLKEVTKDIQAKKEHLGIQGAFAAMGMSPGDDWRWHTHLMNMPLYYEYKDKGVTDADSLDGTYLDNYKQIFDLYINNSTVVPETPCQSLPWLKLILCKMKIGHGMILKIMKLQKKM